MTENEYTVLRIGVEAKLRKYDRQCHFAAVAKRENVQDDLRELLDLLRRIYEDPRCKED